MQHLIDTLLFSLAMVSALMGLVHLIIKVKRALHYCAAAAYLSQAGTLGLRWLMNSGLASSPWLAIAGPGAILVIAPSLYLSSVMLLSEEKRLSPLHLLHYAAPLALVLIGGALGPEAAAPAVGAAASLALLGYLLAAVLKNLSLLRGLEGRARKELETFQVFGLVLTALSLLLAAARMAGQELLYSLALLAFSAASLAFSFARLRNPSLKAFGLQENARARREPAPDPRKAKSLEERARSLMEETELFKRQDLSLEGFAQALGESPGRVSGLFNAALGTNFRSFVNEYRLRAAMRELVERPEDSILDIAFDNGFNSKTSFNTLFAKAAGCSPREYRKRRAMKG